MPWPNFSELSFGFSFLREFERQHTPKGRRRSKRRLSASVITSLSSRVAELAEVVVHQRTLRFSRGQN